MRITLIQSSLTWESPTTNRLRFDQLLSGLSGQTDLIVLPEMFTTGFTMRAAENAEPAGGITLDWMRAHASETCAAIVGSFIVSENGKYYNRLHFVEPEGRVTTYDKRHLFRYAGEDRHFVAGTERVVVEYRGWRIRPMVCYDLRFPVWSRNTDGYDLALYVANWPAPRIDAWRTLLKARAIENQCFVAGVNITGRDGNDLPYTGDSCVFSYLGDTLLHTAHSEGAFTITLDRAEMLRFRERFDFLGDRDTFEIG